MMLLLLLLLLLPSGPAKPVDDSARGQSCAASMVAADTGALDATEAAAAAPLPHTEAIGPPPARAAALAAAGLGAVGLVLREASSGEVLAVAALSVPLPPAER